MLNDDDNVTCATVLFNCGKSITTNVKNLQEMETLKNLIEDAGVDVPIPIINLDYETFSIILLYVQSTRENPERVSSPTSYEMLTWETEFYNQHVQNHWEYVLLGVNYLDAPHLRTLIEKAQAFALRDCKTPIEIRLRLRGTTPLLTHEEEEALVHAEPFLTETDPSYALQEKQKGTRKKTKT